MDQNVEIIRSNLGANNNELKNRAGGLTEIIVILKLCEGFVMANMLMNLWPMEPWYEP